MDLPHGNLSCSLYKSISRPYLARTSSAMRREAGKGIGLGAEKKPTTQSVLSFQRSISIAVPGQARAPSA